MHITELSEKITALIDNEIQSPKEKEDLKLIINNDNTILKEYLVQKSLKNLLEKRFSSKQAPANLRENISKQIYNMHEAELQNATNKNKVKEKNFYNIFLRPQFAIPFAIFVIALFLSSPFFNTTNKENLLIEQAGTNNMYVQAINNFQSILKGELNVQCSSSNPEEVKKYFIENGVSYETKIPLFKHWNLIGGVVSEDKGKKFAHQVYVGEDNQILYLYQVDVDFVAHNNQPISLSENLLSTLHKGECIKMLDSSYKAFLWENEHKVYALVTNEDPQMIEENFLAAF